MSLTIKTLIYPVIGFFAAFLYLTLLYLGFEKQMVVFFSREPSYFLLQTSLYKLLLLGIFIISITGIFARMADSFEEHSPIAIIFSIIVAVFGFSIFYIFLVMPILDLILTININQWHAFYKHNVRVQDVVHEHIYNLIYSLIFYIAPSVLIAAIISNWPIVRSYVMEHPEFRRWFSFGKGANAMWASIYSFDKNSIGNSRSYRKLDGIYVGRALLQDDLSRRHIALRDETHHITIAQSGAGKSISAVWPNLFYYKGPKLVIDPKGEHADFHASKGIETFTIDPYGQSGQLSSCINPLDEINIKDDTARGYIQAISDACVMPESSQVHFVESCRTVIEGVIAHVLSTAPKENHNLPFVADLFRGFDEQLGVANPKKFDSLIADMTTNAAAGGLPMDAANVLLKAADRERGSILTTCFRSLKWINDPPMRELLITRGDKRRLSLRDIVIGRDMSVFLVLPFDYMEETRQIRFMRMVINFVNVLLFRYPRDNDRAKVLFVFDEFFKLGYMRMIEEGIVTARGAGAKYWILIQNIGQLSARYESSWEVFIGSANVQVFGTGNDAATNNWVAQSLGGVKTKDSYPLLRPDEVKQFLGKEEPTQIILRATGAPMRLSRLAFKQIGKFEGLGLG